MRCDECLFKSADGVVKCRFAVPDSDSRILVGCTTQVEADSSKPFIVPVYINKIFQLKKEVSKNVEKKKQKDKKDSCE